MARTGWTRIGLIAALLLGVGVARANDHQNVPKVTSHTIAYCEWLSDRVDAMMYAGQLPPTSHITDLADEGRRMCLAGQVRGGLIRLRQALMLLQKVADSR